MGSTPNSPSSPDPAPPPLVPDGPAPFALEAGTPSSVSMPEEMIISESSTDPGGTLTRWLVEERKIVQHVLLNLATEPSTVRYVT